MMVLLHILAETYQNNNNAVLVNQLDLDKDEDDVLFNV
jgi:hypothetical protein